MESEFSVHILKLGGNYFLDFYLEDFLDGQELRLADFHIIPVHTFAKLTVKNNQLQINWFDQNWLEDLIKENKIRISFRSTGNFEANVFARTHFEGGGHKNAAGGDSFIPMKETLKKFEQLLIEYKDKLSG